MKAKCRKAKKGVPWIPQYVGHRGAIWASDVKTRNDSQGNVCQPKKSDGNVDGNGNLLVDCVKKYHKSTKKQVYGEV
jgi:hypothetical protein